MKFNFKFTIALVLTPSFLVLSSLADGQAVRKNCLNLAVVQAFRKSDQHGKIISEKCEMVSFGKALTADFQPMNAGKPSDNVIDEDNPHRDRMVDQNGKPLHPYDDSLHVYDAVKNMNAFRTCKGVQPGLFEYCKVQLPEAQAQTGKLHQGECLICKCQTLASTLDPNNPNLAELKRYLQTIYDRNGPSDDNPASGSCMVWSAWSLDPEVQQMFSTVKNGILCGGVPFTRGELKELMTLAYPDPQSNGNLRPHLLDNYVSPDNQFLNGNNTRHAWNDSLVEDSNLALSQLGDFTGGPEMRPENILNLAEQALQKNSRLMMDLDPGSTTDQWNQPINQVADYTYVEEARPSDASGLTAQDLAPSALKDQINRIEQNIKAGALSRNRFDSARVAENPLLMQIDPDLVALRQKARALAGDAMNWSDANAESLTEQAEELRKIQQALLAKNVISSNGNQAEKHKLFIEYGNENGYGVNGESKPRTNALDYTAVVGANQSVLHGSWTPRTQKLSQICDKFANVCKDGCTQQDIEDRQVMGTRVMKKGADQILPGGGRKIGTTYGLVEDMSHLHLNDQCNKLPANDRRLAVSAFPPKVINEYIIPTNPDERFNKASNPYKNAQMVAEDNDKKRLYDFIKDAIEHCDPQTDTSKELHSFDDAADFSFDVSACLQVGGLWGKGVRYLTPQSETREANCNIAALSNEYKLAQKALDTPHRIKITLEKPIWDAQRMNLLQELQSNHQDPALVDSPENKALVTSRVHDEIEKTGLNALYQSIFTHP